MLPLLQLVTKLSMLGRGQCQVDWRLRGNIAVFPIDVEFASEFELDLITGKVYAHSDRWDLSRYVPFPLPLPTLSPNLQVSNSLKLPAVATVFNGKVAMFTGAPLHKISDYCVCIANSQTITQENPLKRLPH